LSEIAIAKDGAYCENSKRQRNPDQAFIKTASLWNNFVGYLDLGASRFLRE
jgi:hypothetical protein